ncbi:DNA/RNA nuclease SfsA [Limnoraphis robusta]|uniref:Sugar fermentation stimulation protein homolog n=1 Tax=Limnoraphis robusta CS-951 TaxID=1637645 RepID=A0A0F5YK60_9CYAN|nr:DNA/RNA nuclease SfsA [Limnoraphis robusta]KKD39148.1 XRE family transcriptional regulator [Limnoraphis robusta CS-951]
MTDFLYQYPPLQAGVLVNRYKRFFADIMLSSGETIIAHCPNTGPMTGVCVLGNAVQVSASNNPKRKLPYTWELIQVTDNQPTWVGVNTGLPNRVIELALKQHLFPELGNYSEIKKEVVYGSEGKSRVDFWLQGEDRPIFLEVKNTTWAKEKLALFPDTVTERGQKHLRELTTIVQQGGRAVMLYFINRGDCDRFSTGKIADPVYAKLLTEAIKIGVEVLPCRFEVTPIGIQYLGLATLEIFD